MKKTALLITLFPLIITAEQMNWEDVPPDTKVSVTNGVLEVGASGGGGVVIETDPVWTATSASVVNSIQDAQERADEAYTLAGDAAMIATEARGMQQQHAEDMDNPHSVTAAQIGAITEETDPVWQEAAPTFDRMLTQMLASNVWFAVTNYDSSVKLPAITLNERRDGIDRVVWDERVRHLDTLTNGMAYAEAIVTALAETVPSAAWGLYTSGTGTPAPEGQTWVTTPTLTLSGGYEFQSHLIADKQVFLLHNNGIVNATTNAAGCLSFQDLEGNVLIEFDVSQTQILGAQANAVTTSGNTLIVTYNVESSQPPFASVSLSLADGERHFIREADADCPATVTWTGQSGEWIANITPKTATDKCFAFAQMEVPGSKTVRPGGALDTREYGILCSDGVTRVVPVNNNGTITWSIVQ